ncbi:DUF262 domain-containing protein [Aliarcobacter cryaerophilus]|jgi:uncharacterized protein with ParB-like and HNH nuclease domain|uniref:DUF262 domain-containing protein n=1 Tax=Aliarcobacter cryaerophilus TaxID=28198 RepID=UPI0021B4F5F2|nr:DUF262 domain-containing protein [Aliarcobacter cryaerophilus]MCT7546044.1 DUF262 domain-containing protein [Aliarcobacter cryaerophilus]
MSFQTPLTIKEAIENIENNKFLLPSIQREFVWEHTKIEWLFDSLMRNYPISSFLLWQVESEVKKGYKFYKFISKYREKFKTHNSEISVDGINEFKAVLDGQQRLTSIYIGLKGSYAYKDYKKKWENTEWSIPTRQLYLNITNELKDEEDGRVYEFKFLKKDDTKEKIIFQDPKEQKWFRIGEILNYQNEEKFDEFIEKLDSLFAKKALRQLRRTILEKEVINYFLEKEQDLDKALNIFIRINSGGEPLNFSDLIMSIAVANWENNDARQVIHSLVDNIRDKGFLISKDFILKVFLYLYSKDIKFKVANFSKENAKDFEDKWSDIRNAILEVFDLIKTFGFTDSTLTSKNALIPIVYYIYYKSIVKDFSVSKCYENDRNIIKKWLHIMLIKMVFGSSSDTVLSQIRGAFTENFDSTKIDLSIIEFPFEKILNNIKKDTSISDEFIDTILSTQKDDKYTFSILSLLYPNLDYKNNNFHKDHLHPISKFSKDEIDKLNLSEEIKNEYFQPSIYNGIYNLQMLDANENMSKNDLPLKEWIDNNTNPSNRKQFLDNHLIPDVDLTIDNFKEFIDCRKVDLKNIFKNILK